MSSDQSEAKFPGLVTIPTYRGAPPTTASDVTGTNLAGENVSARIVGVDRWTLLLFLSSNCDGCVAFFELLNHPGLASFDGISIVGVLRGADHDDLEELRALGVGTGVIIDPLAWSRYRVAGAPFFALVDGRATGVVTEGVAWAVDQVAGHVNDARRGFATTEVPRLEVRSDVEALDP